MKSFVIIPMKQFEIMQDLIMDIRDAFEEEKYRIAQYRFEDLRDMLDLYNEEEK